jgi:raffinose/stachyose/melibiose transport system substrate-binding protein
MKLAGKKAGYALLAAAYALSAFLVFQHVARNAGPGRVTIRIAHWQLEAGVREAFDAIIRRYEEVNPRVHVVQIAVPDGPVYVSWILTQMLGGTGPDLAEYNSVFPDLARMFQPITADVMEPNPYNRGTPLEGVPWRDSFIDGMKGPDGYVARLHGHYAIAMGSHVNRVVYNKPLLRAITGSDAPPASYRELVAACGRIRAYARGRGLNLIPMANSRDTAFSQSCWIAVTLTSRLGERLDFRHEIGYPPDEPGQGYLRGDWSFDTPDVVAAVRGLREYGAMCNPGFWGRDRDTAVTDFVCGRAVMIVAPSWEATDILSLSRFEIGAFPFPYPRSDDPVYGPFAERKYGDGTFGMGTTIYLSRSTRHRAEAVDFMRFMTSQEGSSLFTRFSNWPPTTIGVKPSAFAAQFSFDPDGYSRGMDIVSPTGGINAMGFIISHMVDLWGPSGGVESFRQSMREGLAEAIRADFRLEGIARLEDLRRTDAEACARFELCSPGHRPGALALSDIGNEEFVYENREILAMRGGRFPADAPAGPADLPDPATGPVRGAGGAEAPADPGVEAGWRELDAGHPDAALAIFERADPGNGRATSRAARFGRTVAILDRQPVTSAQVNEARRAFSDIAGSGSDDAAQGSLFFLGRIAQHHQASPDAAAAAHEYRRLIVAHPGSAWAQTALARLAMLEIYALDGRLSAGERITRAERLLPHATAAQALGDLHLAIARAVLFYRLPPARALPHLIEADRLGLVEPGDADTVETQIIELSLLGGNDAQAMRYLRRFLRESPQDPRVYHFRELLASLEAGRR